MRSWPLQAAEGERMEGRERDVILVCEVCGERTVLGGPLAVWRSESTTFGCECGEQLTLAARLAPGESSEGVTSHRNRRATGSTASSLTDPPNEESEAVRSVSAL